MNQAEQIQHAVLRSLHSRDLYTERQVNSMLKSLHTAEFHVKAQLVEIGDKKLLKKGVPGLFIIRPISIGFQRL